MLSILMDIASRIVFEREHQRLMARRSSLRPGKKLSQEVADRIDSYNPKWSKQDLVVWQRDLSDLVRDWVRNMGPPSVDTARTLMLYSALYCLWFKKKYRKLDIEMMWTPRLIEHWARVQMAHNSDAWRAAAEDKLKAMGPFVNPKGAWARPPLEMPRRPRLAGYSRSEELAYCDAANAYHRGPRSRLLFFFAAAFGAGLTSHELGKVKADDVIISNNDISIYVTGQCGATRVVPVRAMYHEMLLEALATSTTEYLAGKKTRNGLSNLCTRIHVEGLDRIRAFKMRATWIERHIENGTEIPMLLELSGASTAESIVQAALRVGLADPKAALAKARLA